MSGEGKDGVEDLTDGKGGHPESVPWEKYVGAKETIGSKLKASEEKVTSLEEKLKNAPNAEEHTKIKEELETTKTKLQDKEGEITKAKEVSVSEMRETLKKSGVPEDKLEGASEAELKRLIDVLGSKPKSLPDMGGGGGGGGVPTGSPMQLARSAYEQSSKK